VYAYSRLTFLRRIPPSILKDIHDSSDFKNWSTSVFLHKFDPTPNAVAGTKGAPGYSIKETKTYVKTYTSMRYIHDIDAYEDIRAFVRQQFPANGARDVQEITVIKKGLEINGGTPWKIDTACLFKTAEQGGEQGLQLGCGIVRSIIQWVNDVETYLLLCVQPYKLHSFAPLRSTAKISKTPAETPPVWMDWTMLTHNCKIVPYTGSTRNSASVATLILVHATSPANDAAHYAEVKSMTSRPL
jgi:hypothetical protein